MKKIGLIAVLAIVGFFLFTRLLEFASGFTTSAKTNGVSFNAGKTESRSNVSSASTSSSSDNAGFNSRRVLLINTDTRPFTRRIVNLMAERLKELPQIEKLELATSPTNLEEGAFAPDLFLRIDLIDLKESGVLTRTLQATVTAFLANAPWESSHYTQDATSPPLVRFAWNATVDHETTFSGIRSDRYAGAVQNIADELTKGISNQLQTLSEKFPPLPELPREFFGPYQPAPSFDWLNDAAARRVYSYHGLLTHNETFWQFQAATNPVPRLLRIVGQLESAGWKRYDVSLTNTEDYFASFSHEGAHLEIFRQRDESSSFSFPEKSETPVKFVAHYWKPFSETECADAFEKLFERPGALESLLPFQNSFSSSQRKRFYALLEKTPAASPRTTVQLAENYLRQKNTNAAINLLVRAMAMTAALNDYSALESDITAMAKKISPKKKLKLEVTPQTYRDLAFLEITNGGQTFELERDPGQPVLLFTADERGPEVFCFTVRAPQKGGYPWMMMNSHAGNRSTTSSSFSLPPAGNWEHEFTFGKNTLKVSVHPLPDGKRLKIVIQPNDRNDKTFPSGAKI